MKKQLVIMLLLLQFILPLIPIDTVGADPPTYIIDGDKVYIDDDYVYLSAEPHTIIESGDVEFNLISKQYSGDIDVVLGINNTLMRPCNPRVFVDGNWVELNQEIHIYNQIHWGYNRWFVLKNVHVNEDQLYKLKIYIDIIFNTSGKYLFGVKRSIDSIGDAYIIDPWWSSSWAYMSQFYVNHNYIDGALTNFPVLVNVSAAISANCDEGNSLRFLHGSGAGENITEYYYEIDGTWDSGSYNFVWVNITTVASGSNTVVNMYYDNPNAPVGEDSSRVWNGDYLGVFHLNETSGSVCYNSGLRDWDASYSGSLPTSTTSVIGNGQNFDGANDYIDFHSGMYIADDTLTFEVWISGTYTGTRQIFTLYESDNERSHFYISGGFPYVYGYDGGVAELLLDGSFVQLTNNLDTYMAAAYTDNDGVMRKDYNEIATDGVFALSFTPTVFRAGGNQDLDFDYLGVMDEIRISQTRRSDAWLKASYHTMNQTQNDSLDDFIIWGVTLSEGVLTNGTTNQNETSAQLNGFISGSFDGNYNYGFWVATETPVSETADGFLNYTGGGVVVAGNSFIVAATGLTATTQYYIKAWAYNASIFRTGNESMFYTYPPFPVTGAVGSYNDATGNLEITWTRGIHSNNTLIRYSTTSYPAGVTEGTELYNDTGESTTDYLNETKYYTMWANRDAYYSTPVYLDYGTLIVNCYDEETNESLEFDILISNSDGTQSYQSTNNTNSLVVNVEDNLPVGDRISIYVSPSTNLSTYEEFFPKTGQYADDENSTITYVVTERIPDNKASVNVTCTNLSTGGNSYPPFTLDADLITILADDADIFHRIWVNYTHIEYESRMYYLDIDASSFYLLDTYLPDRDLAEQYTLEVGGPIGSGYVNPPINDAYIIVKREVNSTYEIVSTLYTSGAGTADVYLIPGELYIFIISADGYRTRNDTKTPGVISLLTFQLAVGSDDEPEPTYIFWDNIDFTAMMETDGTFTVTYSNSLSNTIDTQIYVYDYSNGSRTLLHSDSRVGDDGFSFSFGGANTSRLHYVYLYYNTTVTFDILPPVVISINPITINISRDRFDLEARFESMFGPGPLGSGTWCPSISAVIALILLVSFGPFNTGAGIIASGLGLGFTNVIFSIWLTNRFPSLLLAAAGFIVAIGIIYVMAKDPGGHL